MENPAYLESDVSAYDSCYYSSSNSSGNNIPMSQRRNPHLQPMLRPPSTASPTQMTRLNSSGGNAVPLTHSVQSTPATTPHQQNPPQHIMFSSNPVGHHATLYHQPHHHQPATSHHLVSGTLPTSHHQAILASNHSTYASQGTTPHYRGEPLYSCQAPRGHDHVYQCPGHNRTDHTAHMDQLEQLEHRLDRLQLRRPEDPRAEYQYGGSDYSSTEPIYAQPQNPPGESGHTPTLAYVHTARTSLRGGIAAGGHGTPARFLVRADSVGASTSSSTLPTVSALLPHDHAHQSLDGNKASTPDTPTPTKLKRQGFLRSWGMKFWRDDEAGPVQNNGKRKACIFLAALFLVLLIVVGVMAGVLYLTLGGGLGSIGAESPKLIEITEKGSKVVTGEFRITNQNFWSGLEDPTSEAYRYMATSIEAELDKLFESSMWSREYNGSEVVALAPGSLTVRAHLRLKKPDIDAARKLGSAFLNGLARNHRHHWLGPFTINVSTVRFSEVLVDSTSPPIYITADDDNLFHQEPVDDPIDYNHQVLEESNPLVGWGQWGSWSSCSPCSPQYDQIRTRQCRLENGNGALVSNVELCVQGNLVDEGGEIETRSCQCDVLPMEVVTTSTTTSTTSTTTSPSPISSFGEEGIRRQDSDEAQLNEHKNQRSVCESCRPGQVCVALQGESEPSCRSPRDPRDPTGCGGLCSIENEVCQALGDRSFNCHSTTQCLEDEWRCADGLCIPNIKRCDGHMNCYDQSDEQNCPCRASEFQCGNNTSCLPLAAKCDGKTDCWDGSDEADCHNGVGGSSHLPSLLSGRNRPPTTAMNRTAIGLSSLSHRERELLS